MSHDSDYLFALEMQRRLNAEDGEGDSDIEEIDFKKPPSNSFAVSKNPLQVKRSNPHSNMDEDFLNRTQNLVHPQWETLDPTPDIFALFGQFDTKFFQSRLKCVTLEWSKRMYSCAGICYSRRNRYGMEITIRLSQPLLILRPRKDLVETMLHEMIHAYCFVLNIREGNGGHGPNFKKIMHAINKVAGTNITVYHTFHNEVDLYKQHWWRCNGICQNRSPFFGYVKRTSNRAPGPNDQWWAQHLQNCGGTFMKIKEPEKKQKEHETKKKEKENLKNNSKSTSSDIRKFFTPQINGSNAAKNDNSKPTLSRIKSFNNFNKDLKGPVKTNGGGTLVLNPKTKSSSPTSNTTKPSATPSIAKAFPPSSYPGLSSGPFNASIANSNKNVPSREAVVSLGGNLRNVVGFKDLSSFGSGSGNGNSGRPISGLKTTTHIYENWGRGSTLTSPCNSANSTRIVSKPDESEVDRKHLRDVWLKRFGNAEGEGSFGKESGCDSGFSDKGNKNDKLQGNSKRRRISIESSESVVMDNQEPSNNKKDWIVVDDDVMLQEQTNKIITLSSDDEYDDDEEESSSSKNITKPKINKNMTIDQRQTMIKKEILDESLDLCDDDIELIDDEYDDNITTNIDLTIASELADTSIIDEFFGEDTLMKEFKNENDCVPSSSRHQFDEGNDIITCPVCLEKMTRTVLAEHLNGCTGIAIKILPPKKVMKKLSSISKVARPTKRPRSSKKSAKEILRNAGYSDADLTQITSASSMDENDIQNLTLSSEDESSRLYRQRSIYKTTRQCPACASEVEETEINEHLDECLGKKK